MEVDVAQSNEGCSVPEFNAGSSNGFMRSKSQFVRDLLMNRMKPNQYSISASSEIERTESVQSMVRRRVLGLPKCKRPNVSPMNGKGDSLLGLTFQYQQPSTSTNLSYQPFFSPSQHSTAPPKKEVQLSHEQNELRRRLHIFQHQKLKQIEEESRRREQRHLESCQTNALRSKRKLAKQAILENLSKKKQNDEAYNKKVYNEWLKNQRGNVIKNSRSCPKQESFQSLSPKIEQIHIPDIYLNSLQVDTNTPNGGSAANQVFPNKATNVDSQIKRFEKCTIPSFSETVPSSQVTGLVRAASTLQNEGHPSSDPHPALDNTEDRQDRKTRKGDHLKDIGYLSSLLELADASPNTTEGLAALELVVAQAVLLDQRALTTLLVGRTLVLTEAGRRALAVARMQEEPILPVPVRRALHEQRSSEDLERLRNESSEMRRYTLSNRNGRRKMRQDEPLDKRREGPIKNPKNTDFFDERDGLLHLLDENSKGVRTPAGWSLDNFVHERPPLEEHIPSNQDIPTCDVLIGGINSWHAMNHSIDIGCFNSKCFAEASISYGLTDVLTEVTSSTEDMFPEVSLGNECVFTSPGRPHSSSCSDCHHLPVTAPVTLLAEDGARLFTEDFDLGQSKRLTTEEFAAINDEKEPCRVGRTGSERLGHACSTKQA